ncbi:putative nad dependent epimerase dehydratase family protein [Botrytis fragariae]|uniref:Putative nad dependent epimerase dehydratase family protein n=1 Tax=Botrytis fragariae TaxID=1964551 RepID=A0A8H6EH09_9HELO|nr:putative nad dependent epimerase dehydratase family protein [Botrytis fragariae]KAF5871575.1 putative nad dependent epimerase dehydratase family protein [Botrytis fragariae]
MASPRVLIFGGNGGIGRLIAKSMLMKTWHVTSVIRDPRQEADILQLGPRRGPKADVLVVDLILMKDEDASKDCYDYATNTFTKLPYCSSGNMSNVKAVDRDAAKEIITASVTSPEVTKFLMISSPASRRKKAPWWDNTDYQNFLNETIAYPEIVEAKLSADEYLVAMAKQRNDDGPDSFQAISLYHLVPSNPNKSKSLITSER